MFFTPCRYFRARLSTCSLIEVGNAESFYYGEQKARAASSHKARNSLRAEPRRASQPLATRRRRETLMRNSGMETIDSAEKSFVPRRGIRGGRVPAERVATKGNKSESRKGKHREDLKDGKVLKSATTRTILWTRGTLTTMGTSIVGFDTERIGCTILYMLHLNLFYYEMGYIILRWIFLF